MIVFKFSATCADDHQLKNGFEYFRIKINSSKDSTNGAPSVSGNIKARIADMKLAAPKISNGNSLKVMIGR